MMQQRLKRFWLWAPWRWLLRLPSSWETQSAGASLQRLLCMSRMCGLQPGEGHWAMGPALSHQDVSLRWPTFWGHSERTHLAECKQVTRRLLAS